MNRLGKNILKYRNEKGYTQEQVAKMVGKTKNVVSHWEKGINKPSAGTIELLLGIFEVDANTLLGGDYSRHEADCLVDKLLSDPKIKELLPQLEKLSDEDMILTKSFINRLIGKDE